jgi:hypothetical protein
MQQLGPMARASPASQYTSRIYDVTASRKQHLHVGCRRWPVHWRSAGAPGAGTVAERLTDVSCSLACAEQPQRPQPALLQWP